MSDYYPDISHHHTVADWAKVEKNCPFMITKATQGTSFVDSAMAGIVKQCEKRGIPYWLYAYLNKGDELAQAKFLVKTCKDKIGKHFMGYVLDVEAGNAASGVQKAMDYLKTLEYKMMLYTMYAQYDKYKNIILCVRANVPGGRRGMGKTTGNMTRIIPATPARICISTRPMVPVRVLMRRLI